MIIAIILFAIAVLFLVGCKKLTPSPNPNPDPEPEPEPTWEQFYPEKCYKPASIIYDSRWQKRDYGSPEWQEYDDRMIEFMRIQDRTTADALTLARILTVKIDGKYFFVWTSDMDTWLLLDYWATPYEFVIVKKGKGDCDDFAGLHCDFLFGVSEYWLVWWIEIYWKQRGQLLGHAITIFKETPETPWRSFSNQQFLGMTNGYESVEEIISKFCPKDPDHELIKVVARHPIEGYLLWIVDKNHGYDDIWLTVKEIKERLQQKN